MWKTSGSYNQESHCFPPMCRSARIRLLYSPAQYPSVAFLPSLTARGALRHVTLSIYFHSFSLPAVTHLVLPTFLQLSCPSDPTQPSPIPEKQSERAGDSFCYHLLPHVLSSTYS